MAQLKPFSGLLLGCLPLFAGPALALQALDDADLAGVSGRDGLTIDIEATNGWSVNSLRTTLDSDGDPLTVTGNEATLSANVLTLDGVGSYGTMAGAVPASGAFVIDAGTSAGGAPLLSLDLHTDSRIRLRTDSLTIPSQPGVNGRSFGTWAFDFEGGIQLVNSGIFNVDYDQAYMLGKIDGADLYYRQGTTSNSWMAMHDFNLKWEIPQGTLGINSEGIVHRTGDPTNPGVAPLDNADLINLALDFEYILGKGDATEEFQILPDSDARGLMHFGWLGSVKDVDLKWMSGGVWQGGTGGLAYDDPTATTSAGLRFSTQWDFVSLADAVSLGDVEKEFRWRLGETADVASTTDQSRINFELGDWALWGARTAVKPSALYFPLIALDVINGAGQGPGGLCWGHGSHLDNATCTADPGAQFVNVQPGYIGDSFGASVENAGDAGALAVMVRDGQLQAYSRRVNLLERDATGNETSRQFDWGLIYSLANVNGNFYLYPGVSVTTDANGKVNGVTDNQGVIADLLLMSQTLDGNNQGHNWDHGTHLMIADTAANMGIGFMSSSFLLAANDARILVKDQVGTDFYSGGLDFLSPEARFNYRATFGGGLLPGHPSYDPGSTSVPQTVQGALIDLNLEGLVNLRFSPSDPNEANNPDMARNFLGYSGALRLDNTPPTSGVLGGSTEELCGGGESCGSYLSIAEPRYPDVDIKLAQITGDLAFTNGRVDVVGSGERGPGSEPKMVIANDISVGYAAHPHIQGVLTGTSIADPGAQPLVIDKIMLGDATLGKMVIPSAQIHSSITLEPQSAAFTP